MEEEAEAEEEARSALKEVREVREYLTSALVMTSKIPSDESSRKRSSALYGSAKGRE